MDWNTIRRYEAMLKLLDDVDDPMVSRFFDRESFEMIDEKVEVLQSLRDGKFPAGIPNYYKILEKYPRDGEPFDL